jgi:hypothetical protein|tara:strand:+ start:252 stop:401 length:150 start_codon:yes stop_codon:yes gene_type:complete
MIKNIIDLLNTREWYLGDEDIDFAKGVNKLPKNITEVKLNKKRRSYGKS